MAELSSILPSTCGKQTELPLFVFVDMIPRQQINETSPIQTVLTSFLPRCQLNCHNGNKDFINLGRDYSFICRVCFDYSFTFTIQY